METAASGKEAAAMVELSGYEAPTDFPKLFSTECYS